MGWLDDLLTTTKDSECPEQFIYWAGLAAISASARRNYFLNRGGQYKLYLNMYILLVAESGGRKSFATYVCKQLMEHINQTRVISGQNSIQAIINELSRAKTTPNGGPPITNAHALLISSEFSTFIVEDPQALTTLTDLYDTHYYPKEWKKSLKTSGIETLKEPYIVMMGATAPSHFRDRIQIKDIEGGFAARTIIVYNNDIGKINPLTEDGKEIDYSNLAWKLIQISNGKGEFKFSPAAKQLFNDWYQTYRKKTFDDRTGITNRLHDHVLKVSMCHSLARDQNLTIHEEDLNRSIDMCTQSVMSINHIIRGTGPSPIGTLTHQVAIFIYQSPNRRTTRSLLLRNFYGSFDASTLDLIIRTLVEGKLIKEVATQQAGMVYEMPEDIATLWKSYESSATGK